MLGKGYGRWLLLREAVAIHAVPFSVSDRFHVYSDGLLAL